MIYRQEIERIAKAHKNFTWDLVVSEPDPSFSGLGVHQCALIRKRLDGMDWTFFVCGPEAMYQFCLPELENVVDPGKKNGSRSWVRQSISHPIPAGLKT